MIFVLGPNPLLCKIRRSAGWHAEARHVSRNPYFYSVFRVFRNWYFLTCAAPHSISYLIFRSPPLWTPKSAKKIAKHGGQIVSCFLTPIFVVFFGHFCPKCESAIHPEISSTAIDPRNHFISSVFLSMHQKRRRQTATRGDQIPLLYLPR